MKKYSVLLFILLAYVTGIYSGIYFQTVNATVKVPPDNTLTKTPTSKPTSVKNNESTTKVTTPRKALNESKSEKAEKGALDNTRPNVTPKSITTVKSAKGTEPKVVVPQGATVHNISTSMLSDIEKLENDLAVLKNKVNIINNIRK